MGRGRALATAAVGGAIGVAVAHSLARFEIVDTSMLPALRPRDYVIATRLTTPRRGAIVVFPHPQRYTFHLVKRIVGLPGEDLEISRGRVLVDGAEVAEPWSRGDTQPEGLWAVGDDHIFVLGDNRVEATDDSRTLGPIPLMGAWRLRFRYWPSGRITGL